MFVSHMDKWKAALWEVVWAPDLSTMAPLRARSLRFVRAIHMVVRELAEGQLVISSSNPDLGDAREELDVDYGGDALSIGFNARYLLDAIGAIGTKEIRFSFQDELSPARVTPPEDEKALAVVMPMRI